ncbi:MAG: hypothetical protein AB7P21_20235 [Lautropia sp.]
MNRPSRTTRRVPAAGVAPSRPARLPARSPARLPARLPTAVLALAPALALSGTLFAMPPADAPDGDTARAERASVRPTPAWPEPGSPAASGARVAPAHADDPSPDLVDDPRRAARMRRVVDALARYGSANDAVRLMPLLHDADAGLRDAAEGAIWSMWGRSGNTAVDTLFRTGVRQLARRDLARAHATFTRVIEHLPAFAEAWNKRATVRFLQGDLDGALADSREALARVPDHFGSLAGLGHIYFRLDDEARAIAWWRRALAVNPNLDSIRRSIDAIEGRRPGYGRIVT